MLPVYSSEHRQTDAPATLALHFIVKVIVKSTENKLLIIIRRIQHSDYKSIIANIFDGNTFKMKAASLFR